MTDRDPAPSPRRRTLLLAAVLVLVLAAGAIAAVLITRDEPGGSGDEAKTPATTDVGTDPSGPGAADAATSMPSPSVAVDRIEGGTAAEVCAGVLRRLQDYLDAAVATTVPDAVLVDNFDQFSDEIFTLADGAEWGDLVIEQLTTVRRKWADAAAAASAGDDAAAQESAAAAADQLRTTIESTTCPTV